MSTTDSTRPGWIGCREGTYAQFWIPHRYLNQWRNSPGCRIVREARPDEVVGGDRVVLLTRRRPAQQIEAPAPAPAPPAPPAEEISVAEEILPPKPKSRKR